MTSSESDSIDMLTERVFLIKRELEAGKIKIAPHLIEGVVKSFDAIRLTADGKVDPSTVDGRVRAMGAAVSHFTERLEIKKKYSILELQKAYFNLLFVNFGVYYDSMIKAGVEPYKIAGFLATKEECVKTIDECFGDLHKHAHEFWEAGSDIGIIHLQDGQQVKANFSGDLFPSYSENSVSIAGLYVDTIILPCPILRVGRLHGTADKSEFCRLLLKHVLTCMTYRDVALDDFDPPIAMILPDKRDYSKDESLDLRDMSTPYILAHAGFLYGRSFSEKDEFEDFSRSLGNVETVMKELKNPDRLIFDSAWGPGGRDQLTKLIADKHRFSAKLFDNHAGLEVYFNCVSRMPQALAAKVNAQDLGSTPFINAETSWLYYTWLLEYQSKSIDTTSKGTHELHMIRAMSSGMDDGFSWLGKVPIKNILDLRRKGLLSEVREILSSGVGEIITADISSYMNTTQRVVDNVDRAFLQHQRFLLKAKHEKLKIYGLDVAPCIVNGVIAITAAYTGNVALSTVSAGLGMLGLPSLKDIKSKIKDSDERVNSYHNTATGILFKSFK